MVNMIEYKAMTYSNSRFDDKLWVVLKVGTPVDGRLRYIEPLHPRATEKEIKWYEVVKLQVIPNKDSV